MKNLILLSLSLLALASCSIPKEYATIIPEQDLSCVPDTGFYSVVEMNGLEYELYRDGSDGYYYIDESQESIQMIEFVEDTIDHVTGYWIDQFGNQLCDCQWQHDNWGELDTRGNIDESLVKTFPIISYVKHNDTYIFTVKYPTICSSNPGEYHWETKWDYLIKDKDGVKSKFNTASIPLVPINCLNVNVTVFCVHNKTGVKSLEKSSQIIVDLNTKVSKINKKI